VTSEAGRTGYFATVSDTYANAILLCREMGRDELALNLVERARSRAFLDMLEAGFAGLDREIEATPLTLTEIQAALPADALLLEYFTTGLLEVRESRAKGGQVLQRHRFPPAKTLIFAVTRESLRVEEADLSPNDLRPGQLDKVAERHFLDPQIRQTLYNKLIAPIEARVRDKSRLYLIPHGPLHYIPFQALVAPGGETLLRDGGPQLIYAPSATFLFRYGRAEPERAQKTCLALGYNGRDETRLRFAEEEARSIARLTGGYALTGPAPKKDSLYARAPHYGFLHFSCHGEFDPEEPLNSALYLAGDESLTALEIIHNLRLHCNLVTLSACESGLSRVRRGDELIGFMRAFAYAGSPALVATLWRVDERSTRILMEKFYRLVQSGMSFAEALKQAQLYLKNLTRRESQNLLVRFFADELRHQAATSSKSLSDLAVTEMAFEQAGAYLKGVSTEEEGPEPETLQDEGDEAKLFADPYYWAPFVLVGDHGS
jgi:CHAT domain-containing protein